MTKHEKYFQDMIDNNMKLFREFGEVHDKYVLDPKKYEAEFNAVGERAMEVIREWEGRLCQHSEGGQYGKYSANLADKFWQVVRENFKMIDFVGVRRG